MYHPNERYKTPIPRAEPDSNLSYQVVAVYVQGDGFV